MYRKSIVILLMSYFAIQAEIPKPPANCQCLTFNQTSFLDLKKKLITELETQMKSFKSKKPQNTEERIATLQAISVGTTAKDILEHPLTDIVLQAIDDTQILKSLEKQNYPIKYKKLLEDQQSIINLLELKNCLSENEIKILEEKLACIRYNKNQISFMQHLKRDIAAENPKHDIK